MGLKSVTVRLSEGGYVVPSNMLYQIKLQVQIEQQQLHRLTVVVLGTCTRRAVKFAWGTIGSASKGCRSLIASEK